MYFLVFINLVGYLLKIDINCIDMDRIILVYKKLIYICSIKVSVWKFLYCLCIFIIELWNIFERNVCKW